MARNFLPFAERARKLLEQTEGVPSSEDERRRRKAFVAAMIDGALLVAASDDHFSLAEARTLCDAIADATGDRLGNDEIETLVEAFLSRRDQRGIAGMLGDMARTVAAPDDRLKILRVATLVGLCDQDLVPRERGTLLKMARAFGLDPEQMQSVIDQTRSKVGPPH